MAEVDIMYGEGISQEGELVDLAAELDIINKSGSWYSYGEDRIGQGRENAKQFLRENPEIRETIDGQVRQHFGFGQNGKLSEEELAALEANDQAQVELLEEETE